MLVTTASVPLVWTPRWWPFTCSLLLLFSKPGFFFFLMGLVEVSCGEWPLEECGGLGNFLFWAVLSVEPRSERDTQDHKV